MSDKISPFKPWLYGKKTYKGGKSKADAAAGKKVYKLSSNENLLGSSPKALAAVQRFLLSVNEYPDQTDGRYQEALENFYGSRLKAGQFITANSGVETLELITRAFLQEGQEAIISNPCFLPYKMFAEKEGAKVIDVPLVGDDFLLDVAGILAEINEKTRLVFITNPNNPTGTYVPKYQLDELIDAVPDHVIVVFDEVYYQFADKEDYTIALPYVEAGKQVIGVNSFSKAYGLAGLRMGYAYTTPELAQYVQTVRRPFMVNTLCLEAAIAALEDQAFIEETVKLIQAEKAFLYPHLDRIGIKYWKSQANFFLSKPEMDAFEFEEKMLEEGIMVRPVASFGAPGCVRITIGTREANEALVKALEVVCGQKMAPSH
ncbi:MAG: histidinol-phosphate transaminase [Bacteroidia bacterium]|nr:histidinol-phosphate transaminase [Bacteroidia bacterium]